jgi:hypothetical protein
LLFLMAYAFIHPIAFAAFLSSTAKLSALANVYLYILINIIFYFITCWSYSSWLSLLLVNALHYNVH